jgi:hypothetical protein
MLRIEQSVRQKGKRRFCRALKKNTLNLAEPTGWWRKPSGAGSVF